MGADDAACEESLDGVHAFELQDLVPNPGGVGLAQVSTCRDCGATAYEASAADDPRRRPL